jgi:hypothetical protein
MIDTIMLAAGIANRRTRYPSPPATAYAVYHDSVTTDGPDGINAIYTHDYTVELYTHNPEEADAAEARMEEILNVAGKGWSKQDRYWLQSEQLYQTIYEFTHIEKRRIE